MPRLSAVRSAQLETRTARLRLPVSKKPIYLKLGPKLGLGYRRNQSAGTWIIRVADGRGGSNIKAIGHADDMLSADGSAILDFWQAQEKARILLAADKPKAEPVATIGQALDTYETDLRTRGGDTGNVARVRKHLPLAIGAMLITDAGTDDLRRWRDGLAKRLAAATVNRTTTALKAALNLAAGRDERITSRRAWEFGLASIPDAERSRNVILDDTTIRRLIAEACDMDSAFGLLVEVAAVTGARVSQLGRLEMQDLQDGEAPRLLVPASRKGRGAKAMLRRPVPISSPLANRLKSEWPVRAPLLTKTSGRPWHKSDHSRLFARLATRCGLDPAEVTIQALRHSSIVRQLLAGVPIRVVATGHDTSVAMIERTYSWHIGDHADALVRGALLDTELAQ